MVAILFGGWSALEFVYSYLLFFQTFAIVLIKIGTK